MRILLTGGTGFFGSRFGAYYCGRHQLFLAGRRTLDICDPGETRRCVSAFGPDMVIHAAAMAETAYCQAHPDEARRVNVDGAVNVARAAGECGAKLVFISTEQVFNGNRNPGPYKETDGAVPDTVYGQNKLEAETLLRELLPELWVARFTWMFGPPHRGCASSPNILWDTLSKLLAGEKIYASPNEFRGMTYVWEMVENLEKLFSLPYGTYHLGAVNHRSRYETVRLIFDELGIPERAADLLVEDREKYAVPRDIRLDTGKARELGLCFTETGQALQKCIREYGMELKKIR